MKNKALNKYVTFCLGDTSFAVPVLKTREIVEYGRITPVPEAPEFVEGVINLRGSVVPVINLNHKFFHQKIVKPDTTSIMIVEPEIDGELIKMGLIVDMVQDVLEFKDSMFEPPPKYGSKLKADYLTHVVSQDNNFILLLDIDCVLSQVELSGKLKDEILESKKTKENAESA